MDTTFPGNALMGRAITDPTLQKLGYFVIIAAELAAGILCLAGAVALFRVRRRPAIVFDEAKGLAILGLTLGFVLWFTGFMTVGAEWFLMWQSPTWNGQEAAFRFIVCIGIVLLYVSRSDERER